MTLTESFVKTLFNIGGISLILCLRLGFSMHEALQFHERQTEYVSEAECNTCLVVLDQCRRQGATRLSPSVSRVELVFTWTKQRKYSMLAAARCDK